MTLGGVSTKDGDIMVGVDTSINSVEISAGGEGGNFWGSLIDAAPEEDGDESGEGDDEDDEALNDE